MEKETVSKFAELSVKKAKFLREHVSKYFIYCMLAGMYVGFGIVLIYSIGAPLKEANIPFLKLIMGASFGIALSLVIFAGSELFTGNNMTMIIGNLEKKTTFLDTLKIWGTSYFGNLAGALLLAGLMAGTGLLAKEPLNSFIVDTCATKMTGHFDHLFFKGVLCNMLVCLAVWTSTKAKDEAAKLIMIFWCLFGFISSGFEHSIANMVLMAMGIFAPHTNPAVNWAGFLHNLVPVTLGNILGGSIFLGIAYWYVSSNRVEAK